jgi:hypothetical protein
VHLPMFFPSGVMSDDGRWQKTQLHLLVSRSE